ncbi:MAG: right-handed parallel beta-helix repeat-containing protein [Thermoplasmata archaeon]|nr:right-handed parallel beta-helix repeat-containing protein [Thermoplasmata archaeon]MBE3140894.1 right-handed parallel beta-helix repeat-containing protein [Thermoplasmata archaeon]
MRKIIKIGLVIGITIAFLTPVSMVLADDTEPPVITAISYGPHAGVRTDPGFYMYQSCNVTDNVSVADVRILITGPVGFTPINDSMVNMSGNHYYYEIDNVSVSGTYEFYIWANDTSGNSVRSNTYYMLIFENYLSYIHVDVNNTAGPWNGTAEYPLQYINDALAVITSNGTIFVHDGVYLNTSILLNKSLNFIGENQNTTILDGGGFYTSVIVQTSGYSLITISNLTLRNAMAGIQAQDGANATVSHCTISQCTDSGIILSEYQHFLVTNCTFQDNNRGIQLTNCSYNQFYHNNFINNMIQVSSYFNTSYNAWDNGYTGNYWDNYRIRYPDATIIPTTGTWDTPYVVNASGNNTDYHPWVYPYGYIDTISPQVTVIYPDGGEVIAGEITIQWSASDDVTMDLNGTILIEYSPDNGSSWNQIAAQQNNTGLYLWNTSIVPDGNLYLIRVSATDEFLNVGSDTSDSTFSINNHQNYPPEFLQISGPSAGGNGILFNFTVNATDPEGDQISYKWDWGDGNVTDWLGSFNSSEPFATSYAWASDGNYSIRVKAKDIGGGESNWSEIHPISIAVQVDFANIKLGNIYIKLFSFNKSFIYSNFLERLGVVIILSSHELEIKAYATDVVKSVTFKAMNQLAVEDMVIVDDNGSDGFSCSMNVSRGVYELNVTAYDINGTLVDKYTLSTVFFIRIGRYATGSSRTLEHILSSHRLRH